MQIFAGEPERPSQRDVVVNLAVQRDDEAPAHAPHRLSPCLGQVENGESAMSERQRPRAHDPLVVGAAAVERLEHPLDRRDVLFAVAARAQDAGDSAHGRLPVEAQVVFATGSKA